MILEKFTKSPKLIAISTFFLLLVISFVLFGKYDHLHAATTNDIKSGPVYLLLFLILLLALVNLILIMNLTSVSKSKEEYFKKTTDVHFDDMEQGHPSAASKQEADSAHIDISDLEQRIIPSAGNPIDTVEFTENILTNIATEFDIVQGLFYVRKDQSDTFSIAGKFAYYGEKEPADFEMGYALPGQTAKNQKVLNMSKIPENYITIVSGLGNSSPNSLMLVPVIHDHETIGLMEVASFKPFDRKTEDIFAKLSERIGKRLSEINS
jgi:putative methionine-R-sulfoxide reductase with GAF domain